MDSASLVVDNPFDGPLTDAEREVMDAMLDQAYRPTSDT